MFSKLKDYWFIVVPLLAVCGSLYQIAFWDTFDLNGLEYLDLSTLVKSFVYPLLLTFATYFVFTSINYLLQTEYNVLPYGGGSKAVEKTFINTRLFRGFLVLTWFLFVTILFFQQNWILWACITVIAPGIYLERIGFLNEYFTSHIVRIRVINLSIYLLVFSFSAGKYQSQKIHDNISYKYVITRTPQIDDSLCFDAHRSDTLKLISMVNDKLFFTDIKNSKIIIYNKIDTLVLHQYNQPYTSLLTLFKKRFL